MSLDERVSDLITRIYCAGADAQAWHRIAADVLGMVGSDDVLSPSAEPDTDSVSRAIEKLAGDAIEHAGLRSRSLRRVDPHSARALVVLGDNGHIAHFSAGAERVLGEEGPLRVVDGKLATTMEADQGKLDAALASAGSTQQAGGAPQAVRIAHPSGKRAWLVVIRPLMETSAPPARERAELLVEIHHSAPQVGSLDLLRSLFDLTARELQVVRMLAEGHSTQSSASVMGISRNTARTHLRSIFAKTGTARQAELLLLCLSVAHL